MTFDEVLTQALELLKRQGRVSYRALKMRFDLDDEYLDVLKEELLYVHPVRDDEGRGLVWTGAQASAAAPSPAPGMPARAASPSTKHARDPLSYTPKHLAEKILTSRSALEGERKQVTVLFADLKGSMELLADRDPEEARQLLDPVLERMMAAVHRYEGTVNQVMGDGIMALFGAPLAHEDHAVRACYAALAMQEAIRRYSAEVRRTHGVEVQIRVGFNSGEVVVRAIGNDLHMDYTAVGQTTHLAARMEQLAAPGSIRLTAETLRLAEGLVQVSALGPVPVKGLAAPVEVYELVGVTALRRRLQTAVARGLSPFVGRQPEMEALQQALTRAGAGQGQVVALLGEPGVGKSRLVYEFLHSHHTQGWLRLESSSASYGKATAYLPVCDLLKAYCHIEDRDALRTVQAKVTGQILTLDNALQDTVPAVLALFEALPADSPFLSLDPLQRRRRTLEALKRVLLRESQMQPLLLVFEDLHWIDSETQAVLDLLVESLPTAHLLLLVNYRPEYQHGWGSKTYYTQLRLDPLPETSAEELLQALVGADASLVPLTQLLIARTQGNPFFLEESVRTLVETGVLGGERGAYRLEKPLDALQVPATVQALLAARIDRLPPEDKRLLQTAAVIGTEVPGPLLHAIADTAEEALYRSLAQLQAAEFLYEISLFPERAYTFKHALTHEVAYGSLLQERRRALHARIVEALEALAGERRDDQVERLAQHALRGEVWEKAVTYCRQAGTRAAARSADQEAVVCFEQALAALAHLPERRDTCEQAIDLRLDLRNALFPLGDFGRILDLLREAENLAEALGDQGRLGRVSAFMIAAFHVRGDPDRALACGQRTLSIAEALGDALLQMQACLALGRVHYRLGDYRRAMDFLGRTVTVLTGELLYQSPWGPGLPSVGSRAVLVQCQAELGMFSEGVAHGTEGVRIAEAVDRPYGLLQAYSPLGFLYLRQGDLRQAIATLERGLSVYQAWPAQLFFPALALALGLSYALAGRIDKALPLLEQALEQAIPLQLMHDLSPLLAALSEAYLLAGRLEDAHVLAERTLAHAYAHQERGNQAYALRLLGDIAARRNPPEVEQAAAYYRQAQALAEALGMRPLQAHCHRGLGRLYAMTGQREQARTELATAIEMYQSMDMTFWLPQAEATLAQVEGQ
jgi:class 3 adenylate cyclase/tetratricopeptide (TPR) repeat protein